MKFCLALPGSRQYYKLFLNYILRFHVKHFIPARRGPSFVQPGFRFAGTTKFSHVIASVHLGRIKKLIKKYSWKSISIDRRYFYCVFTTHMTSICEKKKLTNIFVGFHHFAATGGVLQKRCS